MNMDINIQESEKETTDAGGTNSDRIFPKNPACSSLYETRATRNKRRLNPATDDAPNPGKNTKLQSTSKNSKPQTQSVSDSPQPLLGSLHDEQYKMSYKNLGKCYIFNHKRFDDHLELDARYGTDTDAVALHYLFEDLGFRTKIFPDFTVKEVSDKLKEAASENHEDSCCFVCCILTHGDNGILYAKDDAYSIEDVYAPFRGDICTTLRGKPKLFFIQACQGDIPQNSAEVEFEEAECRVDCKNHSQEPNPAFKLPTHADFLVAISTVKGYLSVRNEKLGTWFIQTLCDVFTKYKKTKDIIQMLTIVNREVAIKIGYLEDKRNPNIWYELKQMPSITTTLTRDLKFY